MPRNGFRASRSASPLTTKSAWPLTASSRICRLCIAARDDPLGNRDELGGRHQLPQPSSGLVTDQRDEVGSRHDFEQLSFSRQRLEQDATPFNRARGCGRCGILLERRADEDIGIEDDPHSAGGSTSCCACLISRSISSSVNPAATTRRRASRRPGISSSGWIVTVTRSCGSRPRRASSAATSPPWFQSLPLVAHRSCLQIRRPL